MERLLALLDYIIPLYAEEGRYTLGIYAIGCTGGRHRSVAVANAVAAHLFGAAREMRPPPSVT